MNVTMKPMGCGSAADYTTATDFRDFVACGFVKCWLSHDPKDPNADSNMARPVTTEDVTELREMFLSTLETIITALWKGEYTPGHGEIDGDYKTLSIDTEDGNDPTFFHWYVRLDDDAIMLDLHCSGSDPLALWLGYGAIVDRQNVVNVLTEANTFTHSKVWDNLIAEANNPTTIGEPV